MRDKILVGVVRLSFHATLISAAELVPVQLETCQYARHQELCDGPLCAYRNARLGVAVGLSCDLQATSKDGKEAGIELIQPPPGSKPGDRIFFEGDKFESTL